MDKRAINEEYAIIAARLIENEPELEYILVQVCRIEEQL